MSSDEQQIRALVAEWMAATGAGDVDAVLRLMSDDVMFLRAGRPPMGKDEFAAAARALAGPEAPRIEGRGEILELEVAGRTDAGSCRATRTCWRRWSAPRDAAPGGLPGGPRRRRRGRAGPRLLRPAEDRRRRPAGRPAWRAGVRVRRVSARRRRGGGHRPRRRGDGAAGGAPHGGDLRDAHAGGAAPGARLARARGAASAHHRRRAVGRGLRCAERGEHASALLRAVPGPAGGRARSSVGVFRLPQDATVELHLVAAVRV